MNKISSYLLIFVMICCLCACGKKSDTKSTSTENYAQKEQNITISSIQISHDAKAMYVKILLPNVKSSEGKNYWLGGLDIYSMETNDTDDGLELNMYGFYSDDTAWKEPKIYTGFQSPDNSNAPLENVIVNGEVTTMEERTIEAAVEGTQKTIPIEITPYTVSICPTESWREDGCFYNVIATTKDNTQYSMGYLPITDDRTASEKKEKPLTDTTDLEMLGDGFPSAIEADNCGVRYVFNQKVDINQIEKIELTFFK